MRGRGEVGIKIFDHNIIIHVTGVNSIAFDQQRN